MCSGAYICMYECVYTHIGMPTFAYVYESFNMYIPPFLHIFNLYVTNLFCIISLGI